MRLLTAAPNLLDYLHQEHRQQHYGRVAPKKLQTILVKLVAWYNQGHANVTARRRGQVEDLLRALSR